jgi:hypothetical protein
MPETTVDAVNDYLAAALFIGLIALIYFLVISKYGIIAHRITAWQRRRERMRQLGRRSSESKHVESDSSKPDSTAHDEAAHRALARKKGNRDE